MTSKSGRTTNFSEEEKNLLAELGREFPEVDSKGYNIKTVTKKTKAWEEILKKFNSQNPKSKIHESDPRMLEAVENAI